MSSKNLATYAQIHKAGKHVIGLPWNSFALAEENNDWFVYAAPMDTYGNPTKYLTLFWINHETGEAVRYCDMFDHVIDPTRYPYSMHSDSEEGSKLVDNRFSKLSEMKQQTALA